MKKSLLLLLCLLFLSGCGKEMPVIEYAAPVIVLEGRTVRWEPCEWAESYLVKIGDKTEEVNDNRYVISEETGDAVISVQYCLLSQSDKGKKKVLSPSSNEVKYTMKDKELSFSSELDAGEITLDTPTVFLDGDMAAWDAVPFATGYRIYYNDAARAEVTENYCRLTPDEAGDFEISVRAFSSDLRYAASGMSEKLTGKVASLSEPVTLHVLDAAFGAKGDGKTNDRAAIQKAIDEAAKAGGGTVVFDGGKTYLTGNLFLRNHVTLQLEKGAVIRQSEDGGDFVGMNENGEIVPHEPFYGTNINENFEFNHCWFYNYPLIGCVRGARDIGVTGEGTVRMMDYLDERTIIRAIAVGFGDASYFKMSGFTVTDYDAYAVAALSSGYGIFENLTIKDFKGGCTDGVCALNSSHLRVTGCYIRSGDDSIDIGKCSDPRGGVWCTRLIDDLNPAENIVVDHNDTAPVDDAMKGLSFFLWGGGTENRAAAEVRDVFIYNNKFSTVGIWGPATHDALYGGYGTIPAKHIRWYDNEIRLAQGGFYNDGISDMNLFQSMKKLMNGDFEYAGEGFWGTSGEAAIVSENGNTYALLGRDGMAWEGLWLEEGKEYTFSASLETGDGSADLFVADLDNSREYFCDSFSGSVRAEMTFTVPESGNYRVGVAGKGGDVRFDDVTLRFALSDGSIYDASVTTGFSVPDGGNRWLIDYNVLPDPALELEAGQLVQVAYFFDIEEFTDPNGSFTFSPLIQRQTQGWASIGEGSVKVKFSELEAYGEKQILLFRMRLPKGYDPAVDAISPRLLVDSGVEFTWDRLIVADEEKDFSTFDGYDIGCEKDFTSGGLKVS